MARTIKQPILVDYNAAKSWCNASHGIRAQTSATLKTISKLTWISSFGYIGRFHSSKISQIGTVATFTLEWNQYSVKFLVAWFVIGKLLCYTPYLSDGFEGCFAWSKGAHTKSISRRKKNTHPKCWIVNEPLSDKSLPIFKKRENHAVFRWFVCLTAFHMYIKSWSRNQIHYIDCIW